MDFIEISLPLGVTDLGELFGGVEGDYDDTGQDGDDTDNEEDFE